MRRWWLCSGMLAVSVGLLVPSPSEACMRMRPRKVKQVDRKLQNVRKAEHLLATGKDKAALKVAKRTFRKFQATTGEPGPGQALFNRAQRTIALATIRSEGALDLGRDMRGKSEYERLVNVTWAVTVLEVQAAAEPDNLLLRTYFAEALSHQPGGEGRALDMLRQIADDDLMPTARGFALMASLQQRLGDVSGRDLSLQRCRELGADEDDCTRA